MSSSPIEEQPSKTITPPVTLNGFVYLSVVYLVWGSTYLAIRFGVREGSGFPPFTLGYRRLLLAGAILLVWAWLAGQRVRPNKKELLTLAVSGLLLWTGGNGLVMWAEQHADSSYAALLIGMTPIWVALMESFLDRKWPSRLLVASLLMGATGVGLLSAPRLVTAERANVLALIALLLASLSWGSGTILQQRRPVHLPPRVSSAYQHFFGGSGFVILAFLAREPIAPHPTIAAWLAWGYLVLFGSVIAFTSFLNALRLLPINIVMTYGYVNPVIAVFLGWLILSEPLTGWTIGGTALILLGVAGVFRDRYKKNHAPG